MHVCVLGTQRLPVQRADRRLADGRFSWGTGGDGAWAVHAGSCGRPGTYSALCGPIAKTEREGFEPPQDSPEKTTVSEQGGAESGAHTAPTAVSDPDLVAVISAWPKLPEAVRAGIVAMVKASSK